MTLIEERCELKPPCASCSRRKSFNSAIARVCPAFDRYMDTPVMERRKAVYREHLRSLERMCSFGQAR